VNKEKKKKGAMESISPFYSLTQGVNYSPPWQDLSIIGIAGCSGSGKTSVAMEIVKSLNLPWVVILSLVWLAFKCFDLRKMA
jgi:Ni2+-binding GTPase involved in maturation of urease and hydrogenase